MFDEFRLMPGYLFKLNRKGEYEHHVGFTYRLRDSDMCPNCNKRLIHYLGLDTRDPRLNLQGCGVEMLPLYYCMRCCILEDRFVYRVHPTHVEIIQFDANYGDNANQYTRDWYESGLPDRFPERSITLHQMSAYLEELIDRMNAGHKPSEEERYKIAEETDSFHFDGRPQANLIRQIGGMTHFFFQEPDLPHCLACEREGIKTPMGFLASLFNDSEMSGFEFDEHPPPPFFQGSYVVAHDAVHLLFFLCPRCYAIEVQHTCS